MSIFCSVVCSLWVSFSIVSIEMGVVGFMTLWGINLDGVALINLIMCIGFSVDFSAHICYHYITCSDSDSGGNEHTFKVHIITSTLSLLSPRSIANSAY